MIRIFAAIAAVAIASPAFAADLKVTDRIAGADGGWDYSSVDTAGNRLFVSRSDGVMTVDLNTRKVTPQFVAGGKVHASFIIPGTTTGIATNGLTSTATLFDAATGAIKATIKTGAKPDAATWDPASKTVWVMNADDGTATIIDPVGMKAVGSVKIGGALEFAVTDGKGLLFVNVEDKSELAMVDTIGRKVLRRTALPGCIEPSGLALTARGVLIAACANGVAKLVDAASGKLLPDVAIGAHPDAVINDVARNRAYVPAADGTLTVIDTSATPHGIATIATQAGARTGAVDPATGTVYLPTAGYAAGGVGKPKAIPGSFTVLVVAN